ncbi:MAG: rRNA pseudouridine synthase [Leptospiraceae bacterium]|nr:rRNA pseudouridine synthase [Leptospiraceae bacterium]
MEFMRINRFLAEAGVASRRKAENWIREGRVQVNGIFIQDLTIQIEPGKDEVLVDGEKVDISPESHPDQLIALNKPPGYLTSHKDYHHSQTIFDLLPQEFEKFRFSGRLDLESRGLLLLSPNGDLIQKLTHPSLSPDKEYEVILQESIDAKSIYKEFIVGMRDKGETLRALSLSPKSGNTKKFIVTLKEGRKRQLRRMFQKVGARVIDLNRTRIGNLQLSNINLEMGKWKWISIASVMNEEGWKDER